MLAPFYLQCLQKEDLAYSSKEFGTAHYHGLRIDRKGN